jgi:hypothetical protein
LDDELTGVDEAFTLDDELEVDVEFEVLADDDELDVDVETLGFVASGDEDEAPGIV